MGRTRMRMVGLALLAIGAAGAGASVLHARAERADCPGRVVCPLTGKLVCKDRCPLSGADRAPACCAEKRP